MVTHTATTDRVWSRSEGLRRLGHAWEVASDRTGTNERWYSIAGHGVRVRAAGAPVLAAVDPALAHLAVGSSPTADLDVRLWDTASSGVAVPDLPPPDTGGGAHDGRASEPVIRSAWHADSGILSVYDRQERRAVVWVPDAARVPSNEVASPLRTVLHWWSRDRGLQFIHGGAVGLDGRAVLLAGPSGAGKSTAALACMLAGLDYLGDDYVLVAHEPRPTVHSLYSAAKLQPSQVAAFPFLEPLIANAAELPLQKAVWFVHHLFPERTAASATAVGVLVPQPSRQRDTIIEPIRAGTALAALAPSTIVQLAGSDQASLAAIAGFLDRVPSYRLRAGTDLVALAAAVRRFVDGMGEPNA